MSEPHDESFENLRSAAREDLWAVATGRAARPMRCRVTTYHAQQAVEKLIKAALLAAGDVDYPLIHNLRVLNHRLGAAGLPMIKDREADYLTPYAALPRYGGEPTEEEAVKAGELAEKLCARLEEIIDEALAKEDPEG